jgi:hypothetical protein
MFEATNQIWMGESGIITNIKQQYDVWVSLNTLLVNGMMIKCEHFLGTVSQDFY